MWLPAEERRLLMFFTACDPDFTGNVMPLSIGQLRETATKRLCPGQIAERAARVREKKGHHGGETDGASSSGRDAVASMKSWLSAKRTVESAGNRLHARGLIEYCERGTGQYEIKVKLAGWDLGDKYMRWWSRGVLRFREYKDHWIWLIVSFVGGVLGALFVQWLSR